MNDGPRITHCQGKESALLGGGLLDVMYPIIMPSLKTQQEEQGLSGSDDMQQVTHTHVQYPGHYLQMV